MVTGTRFKLKEQILGIEVLDGDRKAVSVPVGTIVETVRANADGNQTVDVLWGNRKVEMFACDLTLRGTEIIGPQSQGITYLLTLKKAVDR
jgi:hypothetical protein